MTKQIKTAEIWGEIVNGAFYSELRLSVGVPLVVVHGLSEAEVREAAALLEKSREVCEQSWETDDDDGYKYLQAKCLGRHQWPMEYRFCPSCGRKVEVEK